MGVLFLLVVHGCWTRNLGSAGWVCIGQPSEPPMLTMIAGEMEDGHNLITTRKILLEFDTFPLDAYFPFL